MSQESSGSDGRLLCRRRFLRVGAGALLVPGFSVSAGRTRADAAREIVLRAGRFTAAPDGRQREVWGYNGQLPGPEVRAKEGDTLRVRLVNGLGVPTSIHWHGMHQPGSWRMDGVDAVSRPPVPPGSEFVYEFRATPAGTHWYHSHVGVQYGEGLFGPLIVEERTPPAAYDREATLLLNDCSCNRATPCSPPW
jgi:FtsP/CotA-like multicopper oxidase with cupredoxin domain